MGNVTHVWNIKKICMRNELRQKEAAEKLCMFQPWHMVKEQGKKQ
jgi:hypothetical protein